LHPPQRGDVVVFKLPTDTSVDYIKRIVGLPGDKIQMIHGRLFINGQMVPRRQVEDYTYQEGGAVVLMRQYIESLPHGTGESSVEYPIIKIADDGPLDNTPVYEVPPGSYFAIGDNRDNSQDSRVMSAVGFIPAENVIGRARFVFYSSSGKEDRFLKGIR
jgi:signal peptidase I